MERIALITGAGRGIGRATAAELAGRGFTAIVNYRGDAASAEAAVAGIEAAGGTARAVQADVCDPDQAAALVASCGTIDALVCNANIQPPFAALEAMPWADFIGKVQNELAAVFHVTRTALPMMRERRSGRIVYISSASADQTRPGAIAHASAKAALDAFARHVAAEAGPYGIAVNTVVPGAVRTDATAGIRTPELEARLAERSVLGRILDPEDVAAVIAAVADDGFRGVSGARIPVDAGHRVLS